MKHSLTYMALGAAMALLAMRALEALPPSPRPLQRPAGGRGFWATIRRESPDRRLRPAAPLPAATEADRVRAAAMLARSRAERLERLRAMALNQAKLGEFLASHRGHTRARLIEDGFLKPGVPAKGTGRILESHRTTAGNALLLQAKDVLFALLFGDQSTHVQFERVERELLALTLPRTKASSLEFMQAATELSAAGTWQDPESVSNDERADNVIIEVEYGEIREEWIGEGILTALRLINNLEVNEQVLYARMMDVEQSTLAE